MYEQYLGEAVYPAVPKPTFAVLPQPVHPLVDLGEAGGEPKPWHWLLAGAIGLGLVAVTVMEQRNKRAQRAYMAKWTEAFRRKQSRRK